MAMNVARQDYFASADTLRATAILLVVLNHLFTFARPTIGHRPLELGYLGVWGVNCFFLLSGCLLTGPFIRALLDPAKPQPSIREFYTRRFLRIYPLYLVSVLFSLAVVGFGLHEHMSVGAVVTALFMVQNFSPNTVVAISPPLWTMGVDAAFYLLLPPIAFVLGATVVKGNYGARIRLLTISLCAIIACCLIYRFCSYTLHLGALSDFSLSAVFVRNVVGMSTAFTLGALLALLRLIGSPLTTLTKNASVTLIISGITLAILELVLRLGVEKTPTHFNAIEVFRATIVDPLAAVSCALLFLGLAQGNLESLKPVFRSRYVVAFAGWAYAVYLFHYPIMALIHRSLLHSGRGLTTMLELTVVSAAVTLPIAILAHRIIEKPFLALKEKHRDPSLTITTPRRPEAAMRS